MPFFEKWVRYGKLGKGAFGTVYKTRKHGTKKYYAMKKVSLESTWDVQRELDSQKSLPRNANIVSVVDSHISRNHMYLILDYCNTGTLNDYIIEYKVGANRLSKFMQDMIKGLVHLHDNNIVHRDIKPDNILLHVKPGRRPVCKLSDFGLARYNGNNALSYYDESYYLQTGCGTKYFMAPEVRTNHYTDACDVFSLGVVFYAIQANVLEIKDNLLCPTIDGRMLFYRASYTQIKSRLKSRVKQKAIRDFIKSMLHTNYRKRVDIDELELNFRLVDL